YLEPGPVTA
nr:Chain C, GP100 peptide YLEPGPVTA [Homo sapiens]